MHSWTSSRRSSLPKIGELSRVNFFGAARPASSKESKLCPRSQKPHHDSHSTLPHHSWNALVSRL